MDTEAPLSGEEGRLLSWKNDAGRIDGTNFGTPEIQTKISGLFS